MTSLIDNLLRQAETHPDAPALIDEDYELNWQDLADQALRCASMLGETGVQAGDRVALLCPNRPAYVICWLALANLGAVAVSVNTSLIGEGLRHSIVNSETHHILAEQALFDEKRGDLEPVMEGRSLITFEDEADLAAQAAPLPRAPVFHGDVAEPFSIIFTSGTTGFPKGVINSQSVFVASGYWMSRFLDITREDRIMVFLPLFHTNPQMYAVASALETGCALVIRPKFSASRLFEDAKRFGATMFTYVGTVLSMLCARRKEEDRDHAITRCVGGGCPPEVFDTLQARFGITAHELYGMTEVGGWVTGSRTDAMKRGTCGVTRKDMELRVVDGNDRDCAPGTRGEIVVRPKESEVIFSGYFNNAEASWKSVRNLWFHTGDAGSFDADGFLTFHGRMREIIRRGGENISPTEIETVLLDHPKIRDVACLGVPDPMRGEEIKAVIVADDLSPSEIPAFLESRIARHMIPRFVQFAAEIPRTETEKIRREALKADRDGEIDLAGDTEYA
uniref:class I adenylate-forming enzyme family protein n=1 Tax=Roseovarius indicus TaxID=540747 RepID=UPI003B51F7E5